jgi:hypothetical protein
MAVTFEMVRQSALDLPGVAEGSSFGTPCLRVGKTLIARLKEDGVTLVLKIDLMERDILTETAPETFFVTDHYRAYPLVLVDLRTVALDQIESLLRRAWFASASKRRRGKGGG